MASERNMVSQREQHLQEVVLAYLKAVDAGQAPDPQQLLANHPQLATELAAFFGDQERVQQWAQALRPLPEALRAEAVAAKLSMLAETPTVPPDGLKAQRSEDTTTDTLHGENEHADFCALLAPPQGPDELGRLGPYRIVKVLGRGGMGLVCLAHDPQLERLVALKVMLPVFAASASARQRFLREARAAAALEHDHIVPIYQVGEDRGIPFLVMPFLKGEPLNQRLLREHILPLPEVLRIGQETADGLAAAHARGLIHRDIKPGNLWLEGERTRVKILDFGLARSMGEQARLTQSGAILGTPAYMAPEQVEGKQIDPRCDLFSLGCVLYRLCTGELPFKGTDTISTLFAVATHHPPAPHEVNPESVPQELSDLIMRLLAKKPEDRPASARLVADTLVALGQRLSAESKARRSAATSDPSTAPAVEPAEPSSDRTLRLPIPPRAPVARSRPMRRRLWRIASAVTGLLVILVLAGLSALRDSGVSKEAGPQPAPVGQEPIPPVAHSRPIDGLRRETHVPAAWGNTAEAVVALIPAEQAGDGGFWSVAFSPDGQTLALGTDAGPIQLWDIAKWKEHSILRGHTGSVGELKFSPSGRYLASAAGAPGRARHDATVRLWDMEKGEESDRHHALYCTRTVAFSPNGSLLATGAMGLGVLSAGARLFDISSAGKLNVQTWLEDSGFAVASVTFHPDGKILVASAHNRQINLRFWDSATGDKLAVPAGFGATFDHHALCFSSDGKWFAAADYYQPYAFLLDIDRPDAFPRKLLPLDKVASSGPNNPFLLADVAFSPDSSSLAAGYEDGKVRFWDLRAGRKEKKTIQVITPGKQVWRIAYSPEGRHLAVLVDGTVYILRLTASGSDAVPEPVAKPVAAGPAKSAADSSTAVLRSHTGTILFLKYSPDGKYLATASKDKTVKLWDAVTRRQVRELAGHTDEVSCVAFSPDSQRLASASKDGTVRLWEVATGKELRTLRGSKPGFSLVSFSNDGNLLAGGGLDRTVWLWDLRAQSEGRKVGEHRNVLHSVAFARDDQTLVTGGWDMTVRLWDLASGQQRRLPLAANRACFSRDGGTLFVSTFQSGTLRRFDTRTWQEQGAAVDIDAYYCDFMALSHDGRWLTLTGHNSAGYVFVVDVSDAQHPVITAQKKNLGIGAVTSISGDGKTLAYCSPRDEQAVAVKFLDLPSMAPR
jgi:WD40 repeat protein